MAASPRITFGIIVLNGEPFTRHVLRAIYPFAHQIIVVEGSAPGGSNVAAPDGHSSDGTLEALRQFQADEDPERKLTLVIAEDEGHPDGFWPGEKHEQSRAYATRATGDYLWQVDIDEFYMPEDMARVVELLAADPSISAVSFKQITFWGGLDYWVDGWYLRRGATYYHRLFKWGRGYSYSTHRPPTVLDESGRDTRTLHWLSGEDMAGRGIRLYHYSLLLPKQVVEKSDYYANARWAKRAGALEWANEAWMTLRRPYRVHNVYDYPSWLERYRGTHPPEVLRMVEELRRSGDPGALRRTDDIDGLLASPRYRLGRAWLKLRLRIDGPVTAMSTPVSTAVSPVLDLGRRGFRAVRRRGRRLLRRLGPARMGETSRPGMGEGAAPGMREAGTGGASPSESTLRVLLVNKNARGGGAERVAMSLHDGLRRRGHGSWLAVANRNVNDPSILAIPAPRPPAAIRLPALAAARAVGRGRRFVPRAKRVRRFLEDVAESPGNAIADRFGRERMDFPGTRALLRLPPERVDLVHAHNLHGRYFDLRQLGPLSRRVPVALTLHDEWTYTGHCAYTLGLETWRTGCHSCGDLDVYVPIRRDATHANWAAKRAIYAKSRLYVTAPSRWLVDRARESMLAAGVVDWRVIPNGVDRTVFGPGDRREARRTLGLPEDARILLFTAHRAASSPFKDVATVFAAARRIAAQRPDEALLMLALGDDGPSETIGRSELRFVGYEADEQRLAAYYRAADLYLHAARADNFPTTILEAFASGVPVVATAVGGIPEAVRSLAGARGAWAGASEPVATATGVLVDPGNADAMAAAASTLLGDDGLRARLGESASADASARFDLEDQLTATIDWYHEVIADWRRRRLASG